MQVHFLEKSMSSMTLDSLSHYFLTALSFVGDLEKEKSRLQSILATGKDETKPKPKPSRSEAQSPETMEKDRFQEGTPLACYWLIREDNCVFFSPSHLVLYNNP